MFQQDNAKAHTTGVSFECPRDVDVFLPMAPDGHVWVTNERQVAQTTAILRDGGESRDGKYYERTFGAQTPPCLDAELTVLTTVVDLNLADPFTMRIVCAINIDIGFRNLSCVSYLFEYRFS